MVGTRIRDYLKDNGIKQAFLSQKTGLSPSVVSDICNKGRKIDVVEYREICEALNVPLDKFLKE